MQYAIIFPGQGSQSVGMLSDLADNFPIVKRLFSQASDTLGFDLWKIVQEDEDRLNQTKNTQPAMLVAGYATYRVLSEESALSPSVMAGHSLGEYTALVAAGALDFVDGIRLVQKRAELMQSAVSEGAGSMAAILGLEQQDVVRICAEYVGEGVVEAANFNANAQVVIAGNTKAVEATCEAMKKAGAKRAVVLPVSVPSHCSLMQDAAIKLSSVIDNTQFKMTHIPVLHNVDATKADNIAQIRDKLLRQLSQPVLWTDTVKAMHALGVERLIESGPSKVLTGLTRRIEKSLNTSAVIDSVTLKTTLQEIS